MELWKSFFVISPNLSGDGLAWQYFTDKLVTHIVLKLRPIVTKQLMSVQHAKHPSILFSKVCIV